MAVLETARNPAVDALVTWAAIGSVDRWSGEAKATWRRRGFINIQNARTGQVMPLLTNVLDDIDHHGEGRLNIVSAAGKVAVPWLIVHGEEDESVEVADAGSLHDGSAGKANLLVIPGAGHTFGAAHPLREIPPSLDRAITESVAWFSRHLR